MIGLVPAALTEKQDSVTEAVGNLPLFQSGCAWVARVRPPVSGANAPCIYANNDCVQSEWDPIPRAVIAAAS